MLNVDVSTYIGLLDEALTSCIFCTPDTDRIIATTDHFIVMAGLGPIVPGYTIIFPKNHVGCYAKLPRNLWPEFLKVEEKLINCLQYYDKHFIKYEHGMVGGCFSEIDRPSKHCLHAHRVYVPWHEEPNIHFDIHANIINLQNPIDLRQVEDRYIYFNDNVYQLSSETQLLPQFLRRSLLDELGVDHDYCWAKYPRFNEVYSTASKIRSLWY